MKLVKFRRAAALILTVILTISGINIPPLNVGATETDGSGAVQSATPSTPASATDPWAGTLSEDGTTLIYGDLSLDGEAKAFDGTNSVEITDLEQLAFFNSMKDLDMTIMYRMKEPGTNRNHALFTLKGDDGNCITIYHNPTTKHFFFTHNKHKGLVFTSGLQIAADLKDEYIKLTFSFTSLINDVASSYAGFAASGESVRGGSNGQYQYFLSPGNNLNAWNAEGIFGHVKKFLDESAWTAHTATIGSPAGEGYSYGNIASGAMGVPQNLIGDIRYIEFGTSKYSNVGAIVAKNDSIHEEVKTEFEAYIAACEKEVEGKMYTKETKVPFDAALKAAKEEAAKALPQETQVYKKYAALKTAKEGLVERNWNTAPVPIEGEISRTLIKGKTLVVRGNEIATDEDGDDLLIADAKLESEKLECRIEDGAAKITCKDDAVIDDNDAPEEISFTIEDGYGGSVSNSVKVRTENGPLKLEYDLSGYNFNPGGQSTSPYEASLIDARKLSQLGDALEASITFRLDQSKTTGQDYIYFMELSDSENNYSADNDNAGLRTPPSSAICVILDKSKSDRTTFHLNTGAYPGSSSWKPVLNQGISDGKFHTLTFSVTKDGLRVRLDGQNGAETSSNDRMTKEYVAGFFGSPVSGNNTYTDWRSNINTLVVGGVDTYSTLRHTNYGKFGGDIKSLIITDDAYTQDGLAAHHASRGVDKAKEELRTLFNSVSEEDYDEADWAAFIESEAYTAANSFVNENATVLYAAVLYNAIEDLKTEINNLENHGLTVLGNGIRDAENGMFNSGTDNTWLFGGGVEAQGRFSEVGSIRNYVGQFEEYIRWIHASASNEWQKRQRYVVNVGKNGVDAASFAENLDSYIEKTDPKAIAYLIGPEDYKKGESGKAAFETAIRTIMEKSLAVRDNKGFFVIQMPHAAKNEDEAAIVKLYANAAKNVLRSYISADETLRDRIVLVDHLATTNTANFKTNYLTKDGWLNAGGHIQIAKELAKATFGSDNAFPAITNWTRKEAPESYAGIRPAVTAEGSGKLKITIPESVSGEVSEWKYILEVGEMELSGTAKEEAGRTFTIEGVPEGNDYVLHLLSSDGSIQLAKTYGTVSAGNQGGAASLTDLQQKIREKANDKTKSLTWLFMGDSITHGAKHTNGYDGIAQIFEKYLKEDLGRTNDIVVNTAVSSAKVSDTLTNIEQRMGKYKPDIVSIMIGTNDTNDNNAAQYAESLKTIVTKIREKNADALIIFRTPTPAPKDATRTQKLISDYIPAMKSAAEEDGKIVFINQFEDWQKELTVFPYLHAVNYYYNDNLHPGALGHARMTRQFIQECGLDTDTRLANLDYEFNEPFVQESNEYQPVISVGKDRIVLGAAEIQNLNRQAGTLGSIEISLTDKERGTTYTKREYVSTEYGVLMENLANEGGRTYIVKVTGTLSGMAKQVTFKEQEIILSPENETLPFYVNLSNSQLTDLAAGTVVGTLSVSRGAPEGEYGFEFVDKQGSDNDKFEINGTTLKVKRDLESLHTYKIYLKAVKTGEEETVSEETELSIHTMPSLEAVRKEASESFAKDKMALDLDVSEMAFDGEGYLDLGDADSDWYNDGAYLEVLNNMRTKTTGGTIIYRYKTTASSGTIFSSGDRSARNKNSTLIGVSEGYVRGIFRNEFSDGLRGTLKEEFGGRTTNDGSWHTVAMSFDTTKEDYQREVLVSLDGGDNIYPTAWWLEKWRSWFNMNPNSAIEHFAIGGTPYTNDNNQIMGIFNGNISFLTITDDVYTEEELKLLSRNTLITGEQQISLEGDKVIVPSDALYTASDLSWDVEHTLAEFTLSSKEGTGALFDRSFDVRIDGGEIPVHDLDIEMAGNGESVKVTFSTIEWVPEDLFEKEELSFKNGTSTDANVSVDQNLLEEIGDSKRGSLTVRYRLDKDSVKSTEPMAFFGASSGTVAREYSALYVIPSTGTIGYAIRNTASTVNADSIDIQGIRNANWHTITWQFEENTTKIYLDGKLVYETESAGFLDNTNNIQNAKIGHVARAGISTLLYPFSGEISKIKLTQKLLEESEIQALHAATTKENGKEFATPVIEDITAAKDGAKLTFRVRFDSPMMKKAEPVLKIKINGTTDAWATYVSGNATKEYVFEYQPGDIEVTTAEAVNVGIADGAPGFIEGVVGKLPKDVSFFFYFDRESAIADLNRLLAEYAEIIATDGKGFDADAFAEFKTAYENVQKAISEDEQDLAELARLAKALTDARRLLGDESPDPEDPDKEQKEALERLLAEYRDVLDKDEAKYTADSWKKFKDAYRAALDALEKGDADGETLAALRSALKESYEALKLLGGKPDTKPDEKPVKLSAPQIVSLKAVAEKRAMGVKITVQKVANASSYSVFRVNGAKVDKIGDTNAEGVIYDQNPISKKTVSYYAVANSSSAKFTQSDKGASKSIKLEASVKKLKAKRVGKKLQVKLTWKKVKKAKQYIIYRSTSKNSGYVKIKAVKKASFVDKKVKKGKKYYYRVVVKKKAGYSGVTTSKVVNIKKK